MTPDGHVFGIDRVVIREFDRVDGRFFMVLLQEVVDRHAEDVGDLLQHTGVRDGLAPFPFGNRLIRVIQPFSELQLCHAGSLPEFGQVFRKDVFDVVHGFSR